MLRYETETYRTYYGLVVSKSTCLSLHEHTARALPVKSEIKEMLWQSGHIAFKFEETRIPQPCEMAQIGNFYNVDELYMSFCALVKRRSLRTMTPPRNWPYMGIWPIDSP